MELLEVAKNRPDQQLFGNVRTALVIPEFAAARIVTAVAITKLVCQSIDQAFDQQLVLNPHCWWLHKYHIGLGLKGGA